MTDKLIDAEFEEINEDAPTTEPTPPKPSKREALKSLRAAIRDGSLPRELGKRLLAEMGIFQGAFTKSRISDNKRKSKRKLQKAARKKQRK